MPMPTVSRAARRFLPWAFALPLALACMGETFDPPSLPDQNALYWDLHLNHHAVTLSTTAPYDTLTLVATPRNIREEPLADLPAPQWVSQDPERVQVTSEGVLVAVAPTPPGTQVKVTATLTAGNLKHTDYVFVRVVANPAPPVLATFSVHPLSPDSAKIAAVRSGEPELRYQLPVRATDITGAPMTDLVVSFRLVGADTDISEGSLGTGPVHFNELVELTELTGGVNGKLPGTVNIAAEATAFGVTKADTLPFRIGLPITSRFVVEARPDGMPGSILLERELKVGVGAVVFWQAGAGDTRADIDITFTDPTHVAAFPTSPLYMSPNTSNAGMGGIQVICDLFTLILPAGATDCTGSGSFVLPSVVNPVTQKALLGVGARLFPVPGIYDFHSTLQGVSGRIIVVDEREP